MTLAEIPQAPTSSSPTAETKKTSTVTPRGTMRGHTNMVWGVGHLPGYKHIITCSLDGSIRLWDLESGAQIGNEWRDEADEAAVWTMALSPNGKALASGSEDGTLRLWDVETGRVVVKWKGHSQFVTSACWSPDGERVVSGGWEGTARIWDVKHVKSGEPVRGLNPIQTGHQHVFAVSYSPTATMIATGGYKEGIKIWDIETCKLLNKIKEESGVWSLTWTSDEKRLISGFDGLIGIFDTTTWQQIATLHGHTAVVDSITLFPNNRFLASTSRDRTARLWNLDTNLPVEPPLQHEHKVFDAAFSADGKLLSTACWDENVYVWDIHAILKTADLEDLLSMPDVQDIEDKSFLEADATRGFDQLGDAEETSRGFFGGTQANVHSSAMPGARPKFSALIGRFPLPPRRSRPNTAIKTRQPPVSSELGPFPPRRPSEAIQTQQPLVSSEPRLHALLNRLSSFLRSPSNADEMSEHPQPPTLLWLHPQVLLGHLSSLLPRSRLYNHEATEPQQSQTPSVSRPGAIIGRLSSLFRSPPNADEAVELQQWPRQITSSHCSPYVVEVPTMRDREVIFVARRPETASEQARRIKNPKPWVRVVLFLCCVSPGTDDSPGTTVTHCST